MERDELPPELAHMPWDERWELPIPFIVERPGGVANFGILDPRAAILCYQGRLCAMCARKMGAEVALYGDVVSLDPEGFYIEAPIHERCAELALGVGTGGLCPFISRENYRRRRVDDPDVVVLGDREGLPLIGREVPKRPSILAIATGYQMATMIGDEGNMPVYLTPPGSVVRVRTFAWVDGFARELLAEPPEPERKVTVVRVQRVTKRRRSR